MSKTKPSSQFLTDLFTGWTGWINQYGPDIIELKKGPVPNSYIVIIHPEHCPGFEPSVRPAVANERSMKDG